MNRTSTGETYPREGHDNVANPSPSEGSVVARLEGDIRGAEFLDRLILPIRTGELRDLLKLARAAKVVADIDCERLPAEVIAGRVGRCAICDLRAALEPLFREEAAP